MGTRKKQQMPEADSAMLPTVLADKRLQDVQAQYDAWSAALPKAERALAAANAAVQLAEQAYDTADLAHRAGRLTKEELSVAEQAVAKAKAQVERHSKDVYDAGRMLKALEPELARARQDAMASVAGQLRTAYGAALERVRDAAIALQAAEREAVKLYEHTCKQLPEAQDCGENGGDIAACAGLPDIGLGYRGRNAVDLMLAELEAYVANPPSRSKDIAARAARLEWEPKHAAAEREKERRWLELQQRDVIWLTHTEPKMPPHRENSVDEGLLLSEGLLPGRLLER